MVEGMTTPILMLGRRKSFVVTLSINERLAHLCRDMSTRFWPIAAYRVIDLPNSYSLVGCVRNFSCWIYFISNAILRNICSRLDDI